jgi:hypothetical protein
VPFVNFLAKCAIYLATWIEDNPESNSPEQFINHQSPPFMTINPMAHNQFWDSVIKTELPKGEKIIEHVEPLLSRISGDCKFCIAFDEASGLFDENDSKNSSLYSLLRKAAFRFKKFLCVLVMDTNSIIGDIISRNKTSNRSRSMFEAMYQPFIYFPVITP